MMDLGQQTTENQLKTAMGDMEEDLLTCPICFDVFEDPHFLGCGHTFCAKCLRKLYETERPERRGGTATIHCPVCRFDVTLTSVNGNPLASLAKNHLMLQLVERMNSIRGMSGLAPGSPGAGDKGLAPSPPTCDVCEEKDASMHCEDCDENLCDACTDMHRRMKKTRYDTLVKIDLQEAIRKLKMERRKRRLETKATCTRHAGRDALLYCEACRITVCELCRYVECGNHPTFELKPRAQQLRDNLRIEAAKMVELARPLHSVAEHAIAKLNDEAERVFHAMNERLENTRETIIRYCQDIPEAVNKVEGLAASLVKMADGGETDMAVVQLAGPCLKQLLPHAAFLKTITDGVMFHPLYDYGAAMGYFGFEKKLMIQQHKAMPTNSNLSMPPHFMGGTAPANLQQPMQQPNIYNYGGPMPVRSLPRARYPLQPNAVRAGSFGVPSQDVVVDETLAAAMKRAGIDYPSSVPTGPSSSIHGQAYGQQSEVLKPALLPLSSSHLLPQSIGVNMSSVNPTGANMPAGNLTGVSMSAVNLTGPQSPTVQAPRGGDGVGSQLKPAAITFIPGKIHHNKADGLAYSSSDSNVSTSFSVPDPVPSTTSVTTTMVNITKGEAANPSASHESPRRDGGGDGGGMWSTLVAKNPKPLTVKPGAAAKGEMDWQKIDTPRYNFTRIVHANYGGYNHYIGYYRPKKWILVQSCEKAGEFVFYKAEDVHVYGGHMKQFSWYQWKTPMEFVETVMPSWDNQLTMRTSDQKVIDHMEARLSYYGQHADLEAV